MYQIDDLFLLVLIILGVLVGLGDVCSGQWCVDWHLMNLDLVDREIQATLPKRQPSRSSALIGRPGCP